MYNMRPFINYMVKTNKINEFGGYFEIELVDGAPEEAVKAFERYKEALKRARESADDEFDSLEF